MLLTPSTHPPFPAPNDPYPSHLTNPPSPKILGEKSVGTVETAGASTPFRPGEPVAGWIYDGAYAQYTLCHSRRRFPIPPTSLPWDVLGGIFTSMWTAWGSLFDAAAPNRGSTLLAHGGTSSLSLWATLLATDHPCTLIATTRQEDKAAKLMDAGAHHVLPESDLDARLRPPVPKGLDRILEPVGPAQILDVALPNLARRRDGRAVQGVAPGPTSRRRTSRRRGT